MRCDVWSRESLRTIFFFIIYIYRISLRLNDIMTLYPKTSHIVSQRLRLFWFVFFFFIKSLRLSAYHKRNNAMICDLAYLFFYVTCIWMIKIREDFEMLFMDRNVIWFSIYNYLYFLALALTRFFRLIFCIFPTFFSFYFFFFSSFCNTQKDLLILKVKWINGYKFEHHQCINIFVIKYENSFKG